MTEVKKKVYRDVTKYNKTRCLVLENSGGLEGGGKEHNRWSKVTPDH